MKKPKKLFQVTVDKGNKRDTLSVVATDIIRAIETVQQQRKGVTVRTATVYGDSFLVEQD